MAPEISRVVRSEISTRRLQQGDTLLIGGPYIGKSDALSRLDVTVSEDISQSEPDVGTASVLVIDHFYQASQRSPDSPSEALNRLTELPFPCCVAIRPRALDWLLHRDDHTLSPSDLEAFDQILLLEYDPDTNQQVEAAIQDCWSILGGDVAGEQSSVTRAEIKKETDYLRYPAYDFDSEYLADVLGQYGPTLLPPLGLYLSTETTGRAIFSDGIISTTREFVGDFSLAEFISRSKESVGELLTDESIQEGMLGLGKQLPVVGAAGFLIWLYLHDSEPPVDAVFEGILEDKLTPPARATIEDHLDLPPYTIENLRLLAEEETFHTIQRLCENNPQEVEDLRNQMAAFEEELNAVRTTLDSIDEATVEETAYDGLIGKSIRDAASGLTDLETHLQHQEQDLLQTNVDSATISYHGSEADEIVAAVEDTSTDYILLTGNHGTGKTTAMYAACTRLDAGGYQVVGPNFSQPPGFIERHFEEDSSGNVLVASYQRGFARVETSRELEQLFEWAGDTNRTLILECRESFHSQLQEQLSLVRSPQLRAQFRNSRQIHFTATRNSDALAELLEDTLGLRFDEEMDASIARLVELSDGNPEIAKLALGMLAQQEISDLPEGISIVELIWEQVESVFTKKSVVVDGHAIGGRVLRYVATLQGVPTDTLLAILGSQVQYDHLTETAQRLQGYLAEESFQGESTLASGDELVRPTLTGDEEWEISPEPYQVAIFYHTVLTEGQVGSHAATFLRQEHSELISELATTLALTHQSPLGHSLANLTRKATTESVNLLETLIQQGADPEHVADSLIRLVMIGGIPLPISIFETHREMILEGVRTSGLLDKDDFEGASVLVNLFGHLYVNHVRYNGNPTAVLDLIFSYDTEQLGEGVGLHIPRQALAAGTAQSVLEPPSESVVDEGLAPLNDRVEELVNDVPRQFTEDTFSQVWGTAISNIAEREMPPSEEEASDLLWYAKQVARDTERVDQQRAVATVLARAGTGLRDGYDSPDETRDWLTWVFNHLHNELEAHPDAAIESYLLEFGSRWVTESVSGSAHVDDVELWLNDYDDTLRGFIRDTSVIPDSERGQVLLQIYGGALSNVIFNAYDQTAIKDEVKRLRGIISTAAQEDWHDISPANFVALTHTTTMIDIASRSTPSDAQPWFDMLEAELKAALDDPVIKESAVDQAVEMATGSSPLPDEVVSTAVRSSLLEDEEAGDEIALERQYEWCYMNFVSRLVQDLATRRQLDIDILDWLEFVTSRLVECAETINYGDPEEWAFATHMNALYMTSQGPAPKTGIEHLLTHLETELSPALLEELYHNIDGIATTRSPLYVVLVEHGVNHLQEEGRERGIAQLDQNQAIDLLTQWTAQVLAAYGMDSEEWDRTVTALRSLSQSNQEAFRRIKSDLTSMVDSDTDA